MVLMTTIAATMTRRASSRTEGVASGTWSHLVQIEAVETRTDGILIETTTTIAMTMTLDMTMAMRTSTTKSTRERMQELDTMISIATLKN